MVVLALAIFAWPQITRQMRGAVLEVKNLEFVDAATAIGASKLTNLRRHIVPNALAPVIVSATISLGVFIVAESSLSFLGTRPAADHRLVGQRPVGRADPGPLRPAPQS